MKTKFRTFADSDSDSILSANFVLKVAETSAKVSALKKVAQADTMQSLMSLSV